MSNQERGKVGISSNNVDTFFEQFSFGILTTPNEIWEIPLGEIFSSPVMTYGYDCRDKGKYTSGGYFLDTLTRKKMPMGITYKVLYRGPVRAIQFRPTPGNRIIEASSASVTVVQHWIYGRNGIISHPAKKEHPMGFFDLTLDPALYQNHDLGYLGQVLSEIQTSPYDLAGQG